MMVLTPIKCPYCGSEDVRKSGKNKTGKQVYLCKNADCSQKYFLDNYSYNACKPGIYDQVLAMTVNGTGTCVHGRFLKISKDTVTSILKKQKNGSKT